ncbi:HD domain-containing protein [Paractinoplanes maris]|uniref:HD domain-containing protein n=1 Tax=Paractinoplanes maris TaxID=1734446 RepID=UPI00202199E9|nr:hypothetical protein [Actinoplanes maris]
MTTLEQTSLWAHFSSCADEKQRLMVRALVDELEPLLGRIVETFPTYTLHDGNHALNVIRHMGSLLGAQVQHLDPLEAAFLILSAYSHDVGMLFHPDELEGLRGESKFDHFLKLHPSAYIELKENGDVLTPGVAEWYCRWRHADRVFVHLNAIPDERFLWGVVSIRDMLGEVCRSHNADASVLKSDEDFPIDYLGRADLKFCAVLLRLADILDFDRSRSPESVFRFLGLEHATGRQLKTSLGQWQKHFASDGFVFPDSRPVDYPITLIAAPDNPTVDHDIREFLDVMEREFKECLAVRRSCSPKWRDLALPLAVDRGQIHPRGYRYGNYRFELDRAQVLRLFMGDNLYESDHTFVRELLQNAIDTSRHREHFENAQGSPDFRAEPIQVRDWRDAAGRRWIRIDDFGMGMNERILEDYFLAVGKSFYRSPDFKAEMLRYSRPGQDSFEPISRFGIGVLSCFMVADRVEVSTRRCAADGTETAAALRLSLNGLESYYTLQAEPLRPQALPGPEGGETGYRREPGTSIALRMDDQRQEPGPVRGLVTQYILGSPVDILVNGEPCGPSHDELAGTPWRDVPVYLPTSPIGRVDLARSGTDDPGGPVIKIVPLDLTAHSPDPRLGGQMILIGFRGWYSGSISPANFSAGYLEYKQDSVLPYDVRSSGSRDRRIRVDLRRWIADQSWDMREIFRDGLALTHNGIRLPSVARWRGKMDEIDDQIVDAGLPFFGASDTSTSDDEPEEGARIDWEPYFASVESMKPEALDEWRGLGREPVEWDVPGLTWQAVNEHYFRTQYNRYNISGEPHRKTLGLESFYKWAWAVRAGVVTLRDQLHPRLSVSRDLIVSWPWNLMSSLMLAYLRALQDSNEVCAESVLSAGGEMFDDGNAGFIENGVMRTITGDPNMHCAGGWLDQPVLMTHAFSAPPKEFARVSTGRRLSLESLKAQLSGRGEGERILVSAPPLEEIRGLLINELHASFLTVVAAAVLQLGCRFRVISPAVADTYGAYARSVRYEVVDGEPLTHPALDRYPPLIFVEYEACDLLRRGGDGLNIEHPMSRRLLDATEGLLTSARSQHATILRELTRNFSMLSADTARESVAEVNRVLEQLRARGFTPSPPPDLHLSVEDLGL